MPRSCKVILDCMVHKGVMSQKDHDKIVRNLIRCRCRDCIFAYTTSGDNLVCSQWSSDYGVEVDPHDYCSKAERR